MRKSGAVRMKRKRRKNVTYYERLKNEYDRNVYCSPEEKEERFRKMLEAEERRRLKEEYEAEIRKDQEGL